MITLETMIIRLAIAVLLGALVGLERELVGKEAGVRTDILVSAGAALFAIIGISIHYIIGMPVDGTNYMTEVMSASRGLAIIAGVVTGIGFLGAGLIIKDGMDVHGITTAASVWFVAAIGVLAGIGLIELAIVSAVGISGLLLLLRKADFLGFINKDKRKERFREDNLS